MKINKLIISIFSAFLLTNCQHHEAPPLTDLGIDACNHNVYLLRYNCSLTKIIKAAESGDPDAQYALGYMYYYGVNTLEDTAMARYWISQAASQGQPFAVRARNIMSNKYYPGLGQAPQAISEPPSSVKAEDLNEAIPRRPLSRHLPNRAKKPALKIQAVPTTIPTGAPAAVPAATATPAGTVTPPPPVTPSATPAAGDSAGASTGADPSGAAGGTAPTGGATQTPATGG